MKYLSMSERQSRFWDAGGSTLNSWRARHSALPHMRQPMMPVLALRQCLADVDDVARAPKIEFRDKSRYIEVASRQLLGEVDVSGGPAGAVGGGAATAGAANAAMLAASPAEDSHFSSLRSLALVLL